MTARCGIDKVPGTQSGAGYPARGVSLVTEIFQSRLL